MLQTLHLNKNDNNCTRFTVQLFHMSTKAIFTKQKPFYQSKNDFDQTNMIAQSKTERNYFQGHVYTVKMEISFFLRMMKTSRKYFLGSQHFTY
jgi:hypothetical protein